MFNSTGFLCSKRTYNKCATLEQSSVARTVFAGFFFCEFDNNKLSTNTKLYEFLQNK